MVLLEAADWTIT